MIFQQIRIIAPFCKGYAWAAPVMGVLGFCASLAASLAISLVPLLLLAIRGSAAEATPSSGILHRIFGWARGIADDNGMVLACLIFALVAVKVGLSVSYRVLTSVIKNVINERVRNAI